jgi:hypothetical protein
MIHRTESGEVVMRVVVLAALLVMAAPLGAQPVAAPDAMTVSRVQAELQALNQELSRAAQARDRTALERIFAPESVWVHGFGYVDDRDEHIAGVLSVDDPRPLPPFDFNPPNQLLVYADGDVAVLRQPGRATRLADRVWGSAIYVRRGGRWQIAQIHGTVMQPERNYVALAAETLDRFAGRYAAESGRVTAIRRDGGSLRAQIPGVPVRELRPVSEDRFFDKLGSEYSFERGPDGRATGLQVRFPGGRESRLRRID